MKVIRDTHPAESNILMLTYIFFTACFFSYQMFGVSFHDLLQWHYAYVGMLLTGLAASIMVMIVWEEMLFPVKAHKVKGGLIFRNHQTKLKTQILLYCIIPVIFAFLYFQFEVKLLHFIIWALICLVPPVVEKIVSGVNNYNDYLILTSNYMEYKNNDKEGHYEIKNLLQITILNDESRITKKIDLHLKNNDNVVIDLHEMELDEFYHSIDNYISIKYKGLLKNSNPKPMAG